jgi:hypothetical protein
MKAVDKAYQVVSSGAATNTVASGIAADCEFGSTKQCVYEVYEEEVLNVLFRSIALQHCNLGWT